MSHDTGVAMTLIGFTASPGGRHVDGTVQSEELAAPGLNGGAWAALPGAEGSPGPTRPADR
jgi:hypothetical protein